MNEDDVMVAKKKDESTVGATTTLAAERIETIAETGELNVRTLAGDVRDMLIDMFKTRPKPWDQMTAAEQSDICKAIDYASREMVKGVVDEIRSEGAEAPVKAILEGYTDKGDIKATLKIKSAGSEDEANAIMSLHRARGKLVLITIASPEDYLGQRAEPAIDPDQNPLKFEAGTDAKEPYAGDDADLAGGEARNLNLGGDQGDNTPLPPAEFAEVGED